MCWRLPARPELLADTENRMATIPDTGPAWPGRQREHRGADRGATELLPQGVWSRSAWCWVRQCLPLAQDNAGMETNVLHKG